VGRCSDPGASLKAGPIGALAVMGAVLLGLGHFVMRFFNLYHLGGVPEGYHSSIAAYYTGACFLLFFLFGFVRLELSFLGIRVKRG
jgi:hypothetical protein